MAVEFKPYDHDHDEEVAVFAQTNFRNQMRRFGIKTDDRRRHMYIVGKTGMGKSTLLESMIRHDMEAGHGVALVDPHGEIVEKMLDFVPPHRVNDVVYINPADTDYPVAFNILEQVADEHKHLVASGLMGVFTKIWEGVWSARMEYILNNCILALLDSPGNTLLGILRLLVDKNFRKKIVHNIKDPVVKGFWVNEFANYNERFRTEAIAPIQNKVGQFLSVPLVRNIVGQPKSSINMRDIMDGRKILLMDLSKGRIGEDNSSLLGNMLITKIQLAAMSRVDLPEKERSDFYLYVDEFQNFATASFANILSEARKYRLNLIMAHQYLEQMDETVRFAVFGNVGTMVTFRIGAADAYEFEKEFKPTFTETDFVNLTKFSMYMKLMIDGVASQPFSAAGLGPVENPYGTEETVIKVSRERYSSKREDVEDKIARWSGVADNTDEKEEKNEGGKSGKGGKGKSGGKRDENQGKGGERKDSGSKKDQKPKSSGKGPSKEERVEMEGRQPNFIQQDRAERPKQEPKKESTGNGQNQSERKSESQQQVEGGAKKKRRRRKKKKPAESEQSRSDQKKEEKPPSKDEPKNDNQKKVEKKEAPKKGSSGNKGKSDPKKKTGSKDEKPKGGGPKKSSGAVEMEPGDTFTFE